MAIMDEEASNNRMETLLQCTIMMSNIVVKGFMKTFGIIFGQLHNSMKMTETVFSISPSIFHLVFNLSALIVPVGLKELGTTAVQAIGIFLIAFGVSALPFYSASIGPLFQMISIGLGSGLIYHSNTIINNAITKRPGLSNGHITAANSMGAMISILFTERLFNIGFGLSNTMFLMAGLMTFALFITLIIKQVPLKKFGDRLKNIKIDALNDQFFPKRLLRNPIFHLLCWAQALNAVGFLNFTLYLGIVLERHGMRNLAVSGAYLALNGVDMICRMIIPRFTDSHPGTRDYLYTIGCFGGGTLMMTMSLWTNYYGTYVCIILMGVFTSLFVGLWSAQLKSYVGNKMFQVMYSSSVAWSGIVNFCVVVVLIGIAESKAGGSDWETISFAMSCFGFIFICSGLTMMLAHQTAKIWPDLVESMRMEDVGNDIVEEINQANIEAAPNPVIGPCDELEPGTVGEDLESVDAGQVEKTGEDENQEATSADEGIEDPSLETL